VSRTTRSIERMQAAGIADAHLDAAYAAQALVSMVSHFAYSMVATHTALDLDDAVTTLTRLWARGLGLSVDASGLPATDASGDGDPAGDGAP
jgi:hypothetical protein